MEIQSILELQEAKDKESYFNTTKSLRILTEEEVLEWEELKDDIEYFEEFIM